MSEQSTQVPSKKRIFCNNCKNETKHILKAEHSYISYYEKLRDEEGRIILGGDYSEGGHCRFWICAGCEQGTLEIVETIDGFESDSTYFPKRTEHSVTRKKFLQLPQKLDKIYRETSKAFNDGLYILCAVGLRSLIEGICADKDISGSNLKTKINELESILPQNIVKNLHSFRFMGNEAVHELAPPKRNDLLLAIEISEDLLNFLYELDYKARRLPMKDSKNSQHNSN